jgi:WD40 repeat protein
MYSSEELLKSDMVEIETSFKQGQVNQNQASLSSSPSQSDYRKRNQKNNSAMILRLIYVESVDLILAACENGSIYVWGFDDEAVRLLADMKNKEEAKSKLLEKNEQKDRRRLSSVPNIVDNELAAVGNFHLNQQMRFSAMNHQNDIDEKLFKQNEKKKKEDKENESVTKRVAGYVLKKILAEHNSCVTCLVVIEKFDVYSSRYLISSGWDRRICIWDLDKLRLYDIFRNKNMNK